MARKCYGFQSRPNKKGKALGIETMVHNPYKSSVCWTKKRAMEEAKFFKNNYKVRDLTTGRTRKIKNLITTKVQLV